MTNQELLTAAEAVLRDAVAEVEFTRHDALDDALHQTRWLQSIWKYLDEKGVR